MNKKVLALKKDGSLSFCIASEEERGKRRCNHLAHIQNNETPTEFMERIKNLIRIDEDYSYLDSVDMDNIIKDFLKENKLSFNKNPNWKEIIINNKESIFQIGSQKDNSLEYAIPIDVKQERYYDEYEAEQEKLTIIYEFRNEKYECDFGSIPVIQDDNTIQIGESKYRVLPVMSDHKSGYIQFENSIGILRNDSNFMVQKFSMFLNKENNNVKIGKKEFSFEEIENYFNGKENNLTEIEKWNLDNIDPIAFERYPDLKTNLKGLLDNHKPDEVNDIEWRKFYTYKDQIEYIMQYQLKRMGTTFRKNLVDRQNAEKSGDIDKIKSVYSRPLFFQQNNTENIKKDLLGRSNVQLADNLNPLSALSQSRKIALAGAWGYSKDNPIEDLRKVHPSHKGKLDLLDTSSGKNIGLTAVLHNADIDHRGFIVSKDNGIAVSDFTPFKYNNDPNRATMSVSHMRQACSILGGEDPKKLNDSSDKYWDSIKGSKLGVNLNVVYIPHKGTFEDAVVLSESAARKMVTKQIQKYKFEENDKNKEIKVGLKVKKGQYINGLEIHQDGIIKSTKGNNFYVESIYFMGVGDKIAGRHGNKGIVSKILPDSEMPKIKQKDGSYKNADILMSPMGVPGRMNPSQIYETNGELGNFNETKKVKLPNGNIINSTAGSQFIMRLNHIADKKLIANSNKIDAMKDPDGLRLGEMESLLLSQNEDRLKILKYLRNQENSDSLNKFNSLLKSIGVNIE